MRNFSAWAGKEQGGFMKHRISRYRWRAFCGGLFVALVALAVPVSQALGGSGSSVKVPVQRHNDVDNQCVTNPVTRQQIGTATFTLSGNTLGVVYKLSGGETDSTNWLYLYDGGCHYITYLGKFKIDASGSASKTAYADVTGHGDEFFVCGYGSINQVYDCSLIAKV